MVEVLIVCNDEAIQNMLRLRLVREGFSVRLTDSPFDALDAIEQGLPDLFLLDAQLALSKDADQAFRALRQRALQHARPVMVLAGDKPESSINCELVTGADDYILQPFSTTELVVRLEYLLQRMVPEKSDQVLAIHGLVLNPISYRVYANKSELTLRPMEFRLLRYFMSHPECLFTRKQLLERVWGEEKAVTERTVDVTVRRLRHALEPSGHDSLIETVHSSGYRFSVQEWGASKRSDGQAPNVNSQLQPK